MHLDWRDSLGNPGGYYSPYPDQVLHFAKLNYQQRVEKWNIKYSAWLKKMKESTLLPGPELPLNLKKILHPIWPNLTETGYNKLVELEKSYPEGNF